MIHPFKIPLWILDKVLGMAFEIEIGDNDIDPPVMPPEMSALSTVRDFLYDAQIEEHRELAAVLGLPPISEEVYEMERKASNLRASRVEYLYPVLHAYAHTMTAAVIGLMSERAGDNGSQNAEKWRQLAKMTEPIVLSTLIGSVAQMVDRELLIVGRYASE